MTGEKLRKGVLATMIAAMMVTVSSCNGTSGSTVLSETVPQDSAADMSGTASADSTLSDGSSSGTASADSSVSDSASSGIASTGSAASAGTSSGSKYSAVTSGMINFKADDSYKRWSRGLVVTVKADGDTVDISGKGGHATCEGTQITIDSAGTYVFEGTLDDGCITVDADKAEKVRIILNGFSITSSDGPAINIIESDKVSISLEDGTENSVTDSASYSDISLSAAISSKADLVLNGAGTLVVNANYDNGIQSKDDLRIINGTYVINAADDGIVGRDRLEIKNGMFEMNCGGDAFKSTNLESSDKGYVYIADGVYTIRSDDEAIDAATSMLIEGGNFSIRTGGGSVNAADRTGTYEGFGSQGRSGGMQYGGYDLSDSSEKVSAAAVNGDLLLLTAKGNDAAASEEELQKAAAADENDDTSANGQEASAKGIKCEGTLEIRGGSFDMDTQDDAISSNYRISITNGTFTIRTGDDGIHAEEILDISGGEITIADSYEGLEAVHINISGGNTSVTASDDGVNAAGGALLSQNTVKGGSGEMPAGDMQGEWSPGVGDDGSGESASREGSDTGTSSEKNGQDKSSDENVPPEGGGPNGKNAGDGRNGAPVGSPSENSGQYGRSGMKPGGMGGMFEESSGYLTISGGRLYVNADGDGLDANTDIVQTGGEVIVEGPTNDGNGALDYGNSYKMSGGTLTAIGSAGMLQNISEESKSCGLTVLFSNNIPAGTTLSVENSSGKVLTSIRTTKVAEALQFAGNGLKEGGKYQILSDGEMLCEVTLTGTVTMVNDAGEETSISGMQMAGGHARA